MGDADPRHSPNATEFVASMYLTLAIAYLKMFKKVVVFSQVPDGSLPLITIC